MSREIATVGGGCFWCIEAVFKELKGVSEVYSGYSGGENPNPTYKEVCTGTTGHAEVVQITFENEIVTFKELLEVFFTIHDPTTLNAQGADVGTQYRSVIFYHDEKQKEIASEVIREFNKIYDNKIVTEVSPLSEFFKAEEYHQDYFNLNPMQGYCQVVIAPKVAKFRDKFSDKLK